jgi:HPr kinase/phosphorylase
VTEISETWHASCVAVAGRGVLILGASGAGKSALALQLMAYGAVLVADDRVIVSRQGPEIFADSPPRIRGLIEARNIGILNAEPHGLVRIHLLVDLDQSELQRLPPNRQQPVLGVPIDLVFKVSGGHFPAAILHYVRAGRAE